RRSLRAPGPPGRTAAPARDPPVGLPDDGLEDLLVAAGATIDVELAGPCAVRPAHLPPQTLVGQEAPAALHERALVVERHEIAGATVLQEVALPASLVANDRQTARHRLEKNESEALVLAGRHIEVGDREQLELRLLVDGACEMHPVRDAHPTGDVPQLPLTRS